MGVSPDTLVNALVTVVTTFFGFRAVAARMQNKVDVVVYQAKVTELHNVINAQGKEIAVQAEQIKRLDERGRA